MTIKELADVAGVSAETIRRNGKKLFPNRFINGVKTVFTEKEAVSIMAEVKTKNDIALPTQNVPQNVELSSTVGMIASLIESQQMFMVAVMEKLDNLSTPKALPEPVKEDYYTLVAYCAINGYKINRSELALHGKHLTASANEKGLKIKSVPDERWGKVNSYPVEILDDHFRI